MPEHPSLARLATYSPNKETCVASLSDELALLSQKKGPTCKLSLWLTAQDPKTRDEVADAFRDRRVTHRVLGDWITEQADAPTVTASNISHHRTGNCAGCAPFNLVRP